MWVHLGSAAALVGCALLVSAATAQEPPAPIVAFGDSITLGPGIAPDQAYPAQLQGLLRARPGYENVTVINAGVGGNTVLAGLARLDRDVLAHHPRCVLIGFGMNDSVMVEANRCRVPVEQFAIHLREMVQRVRQAGAQVLLATLTPVVEEYYYERHPREWYPEGLGPVLARYSEAIRAVARDTGCRVVDLGGLEPATDIRLPANTGLRDGVHPTAQGYGVIAAAYARALTTPPQ